MSCPYYKDFTRSCVNTYPLIIKYKNFKKCESDDYQNCIIYHVLKSNFKCKYLDICLLMFPEKLSELLILMNENESVYKLMTKSVHIYCLSKERHSQCARYKIRESGTEPSPGLSPEGTNVNLMGLVKEYKLVVKK